MSRQLRIEFPHALYHVASRGNWGSNIFADDRDRELFLELLFYTIKRYNLICHGYCLMGNHYHLLIETPDSNLSDGMAWLNREYSKNTNKRHERRGHLFQGRYRSILVEKDEHFLALIRYLALNPVRAGLVQDPCAWKWSSYALIIGDCLPGGLVNEEFSLAFFSCDKWQAKELLREFVEGESHHIEYCETNEDIVFGSQEFKKEVISHIQKEEAFLGVPRKQRFISRPSLDEIFCGEYSRSERDEKLHEAIVNYGYKLKEVADHLGIHYTTISKILKNY